MGRVIEIDLEFLDDSKYLRQIISDALYDICLLEEVIEDFFSLDSVDDEEERKYWRKEIKELMDKYFSIGPIVEKFSEASSKVKVSK